MTGHEIVCTIQYLLDTSGSKVVYNTLFEVLNIAFSCKCMV